MAASHYRFRGSLDDYHHDLIQNYYSHCCSHSAVLLSSPDPVLAVICPSLKYISIRCVCCNFVVFHFGFLDNHHCSNFFSCFLKSFIFHGHHFWKCRLLVAFSWKFFCHLRRRHLGGWARKWRWIYGSDFHALGLAASSYFMYYSLYLHLYQFVASFLI